MNDPSRISFDKLDDIERVRSVFESANYSQSGIERTLGHGTPIAPVAVELPQSVLCATGGSPLETLMRLFLLNSTAEIEAVRRAIAPMELDTWIQGGLLQVEQQKVIPSVRIKPYADLLVACDRVCTHDTPDSADYVMGISLSSLLLTESTIRSEVQSTLDLGTGNGIQSLMAARHSRNVCAVDVNPRALEFARFNARLNGIDNIEFVEGSLFEPVAARTFDQIVFNPPYVISPEFRASYRDNQQAGDGFCEQIVRQVPAFLNEGGVFQMYFDWAHTTDQPWPERLAQWCRSSSCDGWVLRKETRTPSEYTVLWNRETARKPEFKDIYESWMASYDEQGIEAISSGLITLRRRSGVQNWFRADDGPDAAIGPIGEDFRRLFDAADWLHTRSGPEDLLQTRFRLADNVRMDHQLRPTPTGWQVEEARLRRTSGLGYTCAVNSDAATLLYQCDGEKTLGELIQSMAAMRRVSVGKITPLYLNAVRQLASRGFLTINPTASQSLIAAVPGVADADPIDVSAIANIS